MIHSGELSITEMANAAGCNKSTISRISSNIRTFGSVKAPPIKGGGPRSITPVMLEALCDHLVEKPALYLGEMVVFLWDKFALQATKSSISRAHKSKGWSKKTARAKARERNLDLRDEYHHLISDFKSYHLVYVDESGCDKRTGFRRTGWAPLVPHRFKCPNFIVIGVIKFCLRMRKTALFCLECSRVQLAHPSLSILSSSFSSTVGNGPSRSLC